MRMCLMLLIFNILMTNNTLSKEPTDSEKENISEVVKNRLIDPYSAKFKWVEYTGERIHEPSDPSLSGLIYCGIVNSKNRFGGYVGDSPYMVALGWKNDILNKVLLIWMGDGDANSIGTQATYQTCAEKGYKLDLAK